MKVISASLAWAVLFLILSASISLAEDGIDISGDFRYRHETIDREGNDTRHRHRIRARISLTAEINQQLMVETEISSGSDDPVSNNQSLDDGFSTKNLGLNLAYLAYSPKQIKGLTLFAGKMNNPFLNVQKSELLWDPDLCPEGLAGKLSHNRDNIQFFLNGAFFWVEERSSDDESYMAGLQTGVKIKPENSDIHLIIGGAYNDYVNTLDFEPFFDSDDPAGNSLDNQGQYLHDYNLLDIFVELGTTLGNLPAAVFADVVNNIAIDENSGGWLVGVSVGKTKQPWSWHFRYQYKYLESDAVMGRYTDSEFIGGGTDGKGHEFNYSLQLDQSVTAAVTLFLNKKNLDNEIDYNRLQADLKFRF